MEFIYTGPDVEVPALGRELVVAGDSVEVSDPDLIRGLVGQPQWEPQGDVSDYLPADEPVVPPGPLSEPPAAPPVDPTGDDTTPDADSVDETPEG